jgi:hypothetical protein
MTMRPAALLPATLAIVALLLAGCGKQQQLALDRGGDDGGVFSPDLGDAGGASGLDAHIEQNHVTVTFVTVSCSGGCADVQAVGTGGYPPYTFAWEDGSSGASRRVCPTSTASYRVTVTDKGTSGEFARPAESVQVPLSANVLACTDGGAGGALCIANPSFEGTAALDLADNFDAPPWSECGVFQGADLWSDTQNVEGVAGIKASQGSTYARMGWPGPLSNGGEIVSETTCAPMSAGTAYSMTIDLAYEAAFAEPGYLELWGASAQCGEEELLWTSPIVGTAWETYCVSFTPKTDLTALTLKPRVEADAQAPADGTPIETILFADNIVPVASCP